MPDPAHLSFSSNSINFGSPSSIKDKEKERTMTINDLFLGSQNNYGDDECIQYLADASLRPQMIRPPPPLYLSVDGDELNWLNPVDCEECLGDLEFVFEPRMCVESRASSLTEARRLMHRACKGRL